MLVISIGNIPQSFADLILAFKGIPSFLASFISIVFIWLGHRKWSRRYGIENNFTMLVSFGLVFMLMIYIYPLRLVFSALFAWLSNYYFPSEFVITDSSELVSLFIFYGFGFAIIAALLASLFYYGYKSKQLLHLNKIEILLTKTEVSSWFTLALTALLSSIFAIIAPMKLGVYAGFIYCILPIVMPFISIYYSKQIKLILL